MPKDLIELVEQVGAEYSFFAGTEHAWHLKLVSDLATRAVLRDGSSQIVTQFMELGDGRRIAYLPMYGSKERTREWWIVMGRFQSDHVMAIQGVIVKGIPQLLERMTSSRGRYYFDDPDFVSDGSL